MATLSKDGASSWRARGVAKRDARLAPGGTEVAPSPPAKKDTKRWCRGRQGRAHGFLVAVSRRESFPRLIAYCPECGKEFGSYHRVSWWSGDVPPTWATPEMLKELEVAKQECDAKRKRELEARKK